MYELKDMYKNLHRAGLGNFAKGYYWSSDEVPPIYAWDVNFTTGIQYCSGKQSPGLYVWSGLFDSYFAIRKPFQSFGIFEPNNNLTLCYSQTKSRNKSTRSPAYIDIRRGRFYRCQSLSYHR